MGLKITPQISVCPSRPIATKTSGGLQPDLTSSAVSLRSITVTSDPSSARRSSETGASSTGEYVSTKYFMSGENAA